MARLPRHTIQERFSGRGDAVFQRRAFDPQRALGELPGAINRFVEQRVRSEAEGAWADMQTHLFEAERQLKKEIESVPMDQSGQLDEDAYRERLDSIVSEQMDKLESPVAARLRPQAERLRGVVWAGVADSLQRQKDAVNYAKALEAGEELVNKAIDAHVDGSPEQRRLWLESMEDHWTRQAGTHIDESKIPEVIRNSKDQVYAYAVERLVDRRSEEFERMLGMARSIEKPNARERAVSSVEALREDLRTKRVYTEAWGRLRAARRGEGGLSAAKAFIEGNAEALGDQYFTMLSAVDSMERAAAERARENAAFGVQQDVFDRLVEGDTQGAKALLDQNRNRIGFDNYRRISADIADAARQERSRELTRRRRNDQAREFQQLFQQLRESIINNAEAPEEQLIEEIDRALTEDRITAGQYNTLAGAITQERARAAAQRIDRGRYERKLAAGIKPGPDDTAHVEDDWRALLAAGGDFPDPALVFDFVESHGVHPDMVETGLSYMNSEGNQYFEYGATMLRRIRAANPKGFEDALDKDELRWLERVWSEIDTVTRGETSRGEDDPDEARNANISRAKNLWEGLRAGQVETVESLADTDVEKYNEEADAALSRLRGGVYSRAKDIPGVLLEAGLKKIGFGNPLWPDGRQALSTQQEQIGARMTILPGDTEVPPIPNDAAELYRRTYALARSGGVGRGVAEESALAALGQRWGISRIGSPAPYWTERPIDGLIRERYSSAPPADLERRMNAIENVVDRQVELLATEAEDWNPEAARLWRQRRGAARAGRFDALAGAAMLPSAQRPTPFVTRLRYVRDGRDGAPQYMLQFLGEDGDWKAFSAPGGGGAVYLDAHEFLQTVEEGVDEMSAEEQEAFYRSGTLPDHTITDMFGAR